MNFPDKVSNSESLWFSKKMSTVNGFYELPFPSPFHILLYGNEIVPGPSRQIGESYIILFNSYPDFRPQPIFRLVLLCFIDILVILEKDIRTKPFQQI